MSTFFLYLFAGLAGSIVLAVGGFNLLFNRLQTQSLPAESNSVLLKKNPDINIENYSGLFYRTGMIFALLFAIIALSYTIYDVAIKDVGASKTPIDEEFITIEPAAKMEQPKNQPPPPEKKMPVVVTEVKIVNDNTATDKAEDIKTDEIKSDTKIDLPPLPPGGSTEENIPEFMDFPLVETKPEFPGGEKDLLKFIAGTPFANPCKQMDMEGTVYVRFLVGKDGKVKDVEIAKSPHQCFDKAVLNYFEKMPDWKPGMHRGQPVNVRYIAPIKFYLRG